MPAHNVAHPVIIVLRLHGPLVNNTVGDTTYQG